MPEAQIWKRFIWQWRYWIVMGAMASPILIHILFPALLPDWMVAILEMMIEAFI